MLAVPRALGTHLVSADATCARIFWSTTKAQVARNAAFVRADLHYGRLKIGATNALFNSNSADSTKQTVRCVSSHKYQTRMRNAL